MPEKKTTATITMRGETSKSAEAHFLPTESDIKLNEAKRREDNEEQQRHTQKKAEK